MKKFLIYLLVFIVFLIVFPVQHTLAAEQRVIKVGAFNNYPVIFKDTDGNIKGLYVDLLSDIGSKENIKFTYVFGTWSEGLDRIKTGEVDLLTSVAFTEERSQFMDYTINPLLTVWGELYVPASSTIDSILELSDKKIGVMTGDINAKNFQELTSKFNVSCQFVEFASYDEVFKAVSEDKVDAAVAGITFGMANATKYRLRSTGVVFNPLDLFFTTAKEKNHDVLLLLDTYLAKWKGQDNSVFSQTKQKWMLGSANTIAILPSWLAYVLIVFVVTLIMAVAFIVLLRMRISQATLKIRQETEAQRESEEKYRFLVDRMQELAIILDEKGMIKFANKITFKTLGYPSEEVLEKPITDFILQESYEKAITSIQQEFLGKPQPGFEIQVKCKNGDIRILLIADASNPIVKDGKMVGILVNASDITEKKKAEEELIKSKIVLQEKIDELEKFNKLTVSREVKMQELKKELQDLKKP
jgi:two-component system, cell cycle sensor histidine kinase and response regulator CckA